MWRCGEKRNTEKIFVGEHESKRPLGRSTHKLEDDIKMDLKVIGQEVMDLFVWHKIEISSGCCEHKNKPLDFIQ